MSAKLQLTRQQLAEFLKDPEAIKVMERLLAIGNSIRDNIFSQAITITSNTTIGLLDHLVLIDTANAVTITIPEGCPIGHEIKITRLVASTNAVKVARSGTETIEGGATFITHGSTVASTLNNSEVVLKKISATSWQFVGGEISGSNANGFYVKYANGTMEQWFDQTVSIAVTTVYAESYYGHKTWTFPISFTNSPVFCYMTARTPGKITSCASTNSARPSSAGSFYVQDLNVNGTNDYYCQYFAIGRWK